MQLRSRVAAVTALMAALLFSQACSQIESPTSPSSVSAPGASGAAASWSQMVGASVVDWSCFADHAGCQIMPLGEMLTGQDAPGAPSNLAFTVSGSTVTITWSPPGGGGAVVSYTIEAGTGAGLSNITSFNTGSTTTALTVTGVPNGTYFVRVRARNADGTSGPSNEVTIVVGGGPCTPPAAPAGLTASASGSTLTLSWQTVTGAVAFIIDAGSAPGASNIASFDTGSAGTSFTANSVPNGTYYIRVRVRTACGTSAASNEATVTIGTLPPPPTSVTGRWVGVTPDGIIVELDPYDNCPSEYDLQLDLTSSGTAVTGTATTRLRKVEAAGDCSDVLGGVFTWSVINGSVGSGTISFALGNAGTFRFSGTFTATRMTGTFVLQEFTRFYQTGSFAVNRQ